MIRAALITAILLLSPTACSQPVDQSPPQQKRIDFSSLAAKSEDKVRKENQGAALSHEQQEMLDDLGIKHLRWNQDFIQRSWEWHLFSTKILMTVVLVILSFGLVLTYIQFTRKPTRRRRSTPTAAAYARQATGGADDSRIPSPIPATDSPEQDDGKATKFKISLEGIEVTSQITGVIILALSLAFFFLYARDIYPVQQHDLQQSPKNSVPRKETEASTPPPLNTPENQQPSDTD